MTDKDKGQLPKINMKARSLKPVAALAKPDPEAQAAQLAATPPPPEPAKPKGRPPGAKNKKDKKKEPVLVVDAEPEPELQQEKEKEKMPEVQTDAGPAVLIADDAPVMVKIEADEEAKKQERLARKKAIKEKQEHSSSTASSVLLRQEDWDASHAPNPELWQVDRDLYMQRLNEHRGYLVELGRQRAPVQPADDTWGFYLGWAGATAALMLIRMITA